MGGTSATAIVIDDQVVRDAIEPAGEGGPPSVLALYGFQHTQKHLRGKILGDLGIANAMVDVAVDSAFVAVIDDA